MAVGSIYKLVWIQFPEIVRVAIEPAQSQRADVPLDYK
jgi:hypothetical protein